MDLFTAKRIATEMMDLYQLPESGWTFTWMDSKKIFGQCRYGTMEIALSTVLVGLNTEERVIETIIHEIAHALTPGHGHDATWRRVCREMGGDGQRCYTEDNTVTAPAKWVGYCPECGRLEAKRDRLTERAKRLVCTPCARKVGKPYTSARVGHLHLIWRENHGRVSV